MGVTDKRPYTGSFLSGASQHDGEGFLTISDEPGIGITLKPDAARKYPYRSRQLHTRLHVDGSVIDQ